MASQKGHLDVVKTLIEAGANINQVDKVSTHTYTSKPVINPVKYWNTRARDPMTACLGINISLEQR